MMQFVEHDNLEVKLTDFGFATFLNHDKKLEHTIGTPLYMAPEIIKDFKYDEKVDIWAIGVITYILLSGTYPFFGRTKEQTYERILN